MKVESIKRQCSTASPIGHGELSTSLNSPNI